MIPNSPPRLSQRPLFLLIRLGRCQREIKLFKFAEQNAQKIPFVFISKYSNNCADAAMEEAEGA